MTSSAVSLSRSKVRRCGEGGRPRGGNRTRSRAAQSSFGDSSVRRIRVQPHKSKCSAPRAHSSERRSSATAAVATAAAGAETGRSQTSCSAARASPWARSGGSACGCESSALTAAAAALSTSVSTSISTPLSSASRRGNRSASTAADSTPAAKHDQISSPCDAIRKSSRAAASESGGRLAASGGIGGVSGGGSVGGGSGIGDGSGMMACRSNGSAPAIASGTAASGAPRTTTVKASRIASASGCGRVDSTRSGASKSMQRGRALDRAAAEQPAGDRRAMASRATTACAWRVGQSAQSAPPPPSMAAAVVPAAQDSRSRPSSPSRLHTRSSGGSHKEPGRSRSLSGGRFASRRAAERAVATSSGCAHEEPTKEIRAPGFASRPKPTSVAAASTDGGPSAPRRSSTARARDRPQSTAASPNKGSVASSRAQCWQASTNASQQAPVVAHSSDGVWSRDPICALARGSTHQRTEVRAAASILSVTGGNEGAAPTQMSPSPVIAPRIHCSLAILVLIPKPPSPPPPPHPPPSPMPPPPPAPPTHGAAPHPL
mmetsp:Transcript_12524/g.37485  ORF Transcript_12524/g.37485 Transcript_12524/m.37485 type:complete len:546 (-) Transcript_12524:831-2468(-)